MSPGHAPTHGSKSHLSRCLFSCCAASPAGLYGIGRFNSGGFYYPPEESSMKYCCLGVFRTEYFRLVTI